MQPKTARLVTRRKFQARTEVEQNIGNLRDHQFAGLEEWWRERRVLVPPASHHCHHAIHATGFARHIVIGRSGVLKREPDKFAASLNLRPVKQLITHDLTQWSLSKTRKLRSRHGPTSRGCSRFQLACTRRTGLPPPTTQLRPAAFAW